MAPTKSLAQREADAEETRRILIQQRNERTANPSNYNDDFSETLNDARQEGHSGDPTVNSIIIIAAAIMLTFAMVALFSPSSFKGKNHSSSDEAENTDQEASDSENAFALSGDHFQGVYGALCGITGSTDGWAGDSGTRFADKNAEFRNLMAQIADLNQEVDTTVQTENEQVNDGRETLGNSLNELDLAVPVAQSLYFSGPAGPALSYSFQLAVSSPAINTGVDTTNTMHENSQRHGNRLTALFERYDEAFRSL